MGRIILNFDETAYNNVKIIIAYLIAYGNTRQDDLISFGVKTFQLSKKGVKDLIRKMAAYDLVEGVVHNMLERTVVYFKKGSLMPVDLELFAIGKLNEVLKVDINEPEGAKLILDHVALVTMANPVAKSSSIGQ